MKILVIIVTNRMDINLKRNVIRLDFLLREQGHSVEYAGISSVDDFYIYEDIINFKYKEVNTKYQLTKLCNFIEKHKDTLAYDWFIKFRPELYLVEPIHFTNLCTMSINARARKYTGPKRIEYALSVELPTTLSEIESLVEMDDQIFIFHKNLIHKGGFSGIETYNNIYTIENETVQTDFWNKIGVSFNIIPINALFIRDISWIGYQSGNINI
jgi:hypothetical protein